MSTQTFLRSASVPATEAIDSLLKRSPKGAKLARFETKRATAKDVKRNPGITEGELVYAATIRVGEFPPSDDESSDSESDSSSSDDSSSDSDSSDSESSDSGDSESSDSGAPDFSSDVTGEGEGGPEKLSPEEETNHLLKQILHAIEGGGGLGGPPGDDLGGPGGPGGLDLPDVGAPPAGGGLPAPGGHGPGPVPPPVKPKAPLGGPAFSKFNPDAGQVILTRRGVDDTVDTGDLVKEAEAFWPTHRVAKVKRADASLREAKIALVTLVKR